MKKKSKLNNIGDICNKRLKNLYYKNQDMQQLDGFVKLMESVLS